MELTEDWFRDKREIPNVVKKHNPENIKMQIEGTNVFPNFSSDKLLRKHLMNFSKFL